MGAQASLVVSGLPNPIFGNWEFVRKKAVDDQEILLKNQEENDEIFILIKKLFGPLVLKETEIFV